MQIIKSLSHPHH